MQEKATRHDIAFCRSVLRLFVMPSGATLCDMEASFDATLEVLALRHQCCAVADSDYDLGESCGNGTYPELLYELQWMVCNYDGSDACCSNADDEVLRPYPTVCEVLEWWSSVRVKPWGQEGRAAVVAIFGHLLHKSLEN